MAGTSVEQSLRDFLNIGIGLFGDAKESLQAGLKNLSSNYKELKAKGVKDDSEIAQKLRELLANSLKSIEGLSRQARKNMQRITAKTQQGYEQVLGQLSSMFGERQREQLRKKRRSFYEAGQSQARGLQKKASEFTSRVKRRF